VSNEIIEKVRRRSKFQAVKRALNIVFALLFVTTASGFCWGAWQEVESSPQEYRSRPVDTCRSTIELWSIKAGHFVADMQPERPDPFSIASLENGADLSPADLVDVQPDRALPRHTKPRPRPVSPLHIDRREPEVVDPVAVKGPDYSDLKTPKPRDPSPTDIKIDPPDHQPAVKRPEPARARLDKKSRALLDKAHKVFDVGWKYYLRSRPEAPSPGRQAAMAKTVKYFRASKKYYEAVLARKPPKDIYSRIEKRLVDINRVLYWTYKHLRVR
jgi:hypothetical protein